MNLNATNVVVFAIGGILLYAAIKDIDPRDVVRVALGQAATHTPQPPVTASPATPGGSGAPIPPGTPAPGSGAGGSSSGSIGFITTPGQTIAVV